MKRILLICTLLSQLFSMANCGLRDMKAQQPQPQTSESPSRKTAREWHAASFRGLTVGKSTSEDMLRVFGKPRWSGSPGDQLESDPNPEVWNEYEGGGDFPGKLTFVVDKHSGIIKSIDLYPTDTSKEQAIKYFGDDFIVTRYSHDTCLGNGESAPVFESPDGPITEIEYRERGIALGIGNGEKVDTVSYVKGPIGSTFSRCKEGPNP